MQTSSLVGEDHPHGKQDIQDSTALHHSRSGATGIAHLATLWNVIAVEIVNRFPLANGYFQVMKTSQCQATEIATRLPLGCKSNAGTRTGQKKHKTEWSGAASTLQRPLLSILILCPTTAAGIQFCLLCCQPEPMPRSLTARKSLFTQRSPCRPAAWLGKTIHMASRAYKLPLLSSTPGQCYRQCPSERVLL